MSSLVVASGSRAVCGLKSMEEGVVLALRDVAQQFGLDWETIAEALKRQGRLHLETY